MKSQFSLIFLCLFGLFISNANAQQKGDPPPMDFSVEQLNAAQDLLLAQHMDVQVQVTFAKMIDQFSGSIPADKQQIFKDVMKKFFAKYCSWDALKLNMASIYASKFSLTELKQITAFYKTSTGQKLSEKLPELTAEGMQLVQKVVAQHQAELQQMMADAMGK